MANLFVMILICLPFVKLQRHRILCAIVGVEKSPLCSKINATAISTSHDFLTTEFSTTDFVNSTPMAASKSLAYDLEYICVPFLIGFLFLIHVFYLHFGLAMSWKNSLTFSAVKLASLYRAVFATNETANVEVQCCPTIYNLCQDANVVGQAHNPSVSTDIDTVVV
jgi:hypothetical protein